MDNKDRYDEIVEMIDNFMSNDGGHMNITVDGSGEMNTDCEYIEKSSIRFGCLDCVSGAACSVPTLFEGMDRPEYDERSFSYDDKQSADR